MIFMLYSSINFTVGNILTAAPFSNSPARVVFLLEELLLQQTVSYLIGQ